MNRPGEQHSHASSCLLLPVNERRRDLYRNENREKIDFTR